MGGPRAGKNPYPASVGAADSSPDEKRVVMARAGGFIRGWDTGRGARVRRQRVEQSGP